MPFRSSRHISYPNHVLLSARCRLVIRLAHWDLCYLFSFHDHGRTAAWEAVEGEKGREEEREGQEIEYCIPLDSAVVQYVNTFM
jgi:hypothetical protein